MEHLTFPIAHADSYLKPMCPSTIFHLRRGCGNCRQFSEEPRQWSGPLLHADPLGYHIPA